jgi:hypothetical protein
MLSPSSSYFSTLPAPLPCPHKGRGALAVPEDMTGWAHPATSVVEAAFIGRGGGGGEGKRRVEVPIAQGAPSILKVESSMGLKP